MFFYRKRVCVANLLIFALYFLHFAFVINMATFLNVKILSPTQTIYDGPALSVSSTNSSGKFDILPYHANFITLVQKSPVILRIANLGKTELGAEFMDEVFGKNIREIKYDFDTAIIFTKDNNVKVYTNIQLDFDSHK